MKLLSLLSLASLLLLIPSCQRSCCPTVTRCCDTQPATAAPYAETVVEEAPVIMSEAAAEMGEAAAEMGQAAAAMGQAAAANVTTPLEEEEYVEELEEPTVSEAEAPSTIPADKEMLETEEDLDETSETK